MLGLAFLAASDQFIMMSMAQILQIPVARPIFEREIANRMYSVSAYYLASTLASLFVFFLYPIFTAVISYWYFGFESPDWPGCLDWMATLGLMSFVGSLWGFSFGTFFRNEMNALQFNLVFILIFNLGAGHVANIGEGVNYFAKFISTVSPVRYGTEMLMSRIVKGTPAEKIVLLNLGYTCGDQYCIVVLLGTCLLLFLVGWANLLRQNPGSKKAFFTH